MKKTKDIITEEEYTLRMAPLSTLPEDDSPSDSESDAGSEFQMGVEYLADETDEDTEELRMSNIGDLKPKNPSKRKQIDEIPASAKVISSNQPSPWMDIEAPSDTN